MPLSNAELADAYLVGAHLEEANLTGAYLVGTNLRHANLSRANLTGAYFDPVTELAHAVLGATGYGYRMWRILVAYLLVVLLCAVAYFELSTMKSYGPPLSFFQAVLISITAFHGRVSSEPFTAGEPQLWVTAFEAVAGLVIEGVFIAMLAQRSFDK